MEAPMDEISIEIESESGKSANGIDTFISKLEKLKSSVDNTSDSLSKMKDNIKSIPSATDKIKLPKVDTDVGGGESRLTRPTKTDSTAPKSTMNVDTSPAENNVSSFKDKLATLKGTLSKVGSVFKNQFGGIGNSVKGATGKLAIFKTVLKGLINVAKKVGSVVKTIISGIATAIKTLRTVGSKVGDVLSKHFGKFVKSLRITTLALIGVRGAFTATRKAVSEYMNYDTQLSKQLQNNWAVLGSLLAPILEYIIGLFSKLVAYVNAFVKAFFGVDLVARANKKGLDAVGKSAKKTKNELGNLAAFDNLNVVDFGKDSDSSGGSDLTPLTVQDIDTAPIDRFIEYLKSKDWYGMGMEIARKFNDALRMIDWDWLLKKANEFGKGFADLFNGLTDGIDWDLLGYSIAQGFNLVFEFVNSFFRRYNFDKLGKSLGKGFNSIVKNIKWDELGYFLGNKLRALIDVLYNFIKEVDWKDLGAKLAEGFNSWFGSIPWERLAASIGIGIRKLAVTIKTAIEKIEWGKIAETINKSFARLDLSGIAYSVGNAFLAGLKALNKLIWKIDWVSIGDEIGKALTSIPWLKILTQLLLLIGNLLLALGGLLWGILRSLVTGAWDAVTSFFQDLNIGGAVQDFLQPMIDKVGEIVDNVKQLFHAALVFVGAKLSTWKNKIINGIEDFKKGWHDAIEWIKNFPHLAIEWLKERIRDGFDWVKEKVEDFKKSWSDGVGNIKDKLHEGVEWIKDKWHEAVEKVKTKVGEWVTRFKDIWTRIKQVFALVGDFFKAKFSDAWEKIKHPFKSAKSFFTEVFNTIKNIFKNVGTTVGNAIGDSFKHVVNTIIGFAENTINKFIRAINKAIDLINEIPNVKISPLSEISIPKLATGTNRIETEGLYHLHKDEAVVPKKYNPAVNGKVYENTNSMIIDKLDKFMNIVENMETTNVFAVDGEPIYKRTDKYIKKQKNIYGTDL